MPPFTEKITTIEMTEYYRYQVYYDLGTDQVVSANDKSDWDLGFECADSSWHILLNTSAFMLAANTGMKDFEAVSDTTALDWRFDKSDGNPDSTAIGSWLEINDTDTMYYNHVYVLDRGLDHVGNYRGLKKIIFTKVDQYGYAFKYANLDGSEENEYYIERDFERNYINFSFENEGQTIAFEPLASEWDLLFTMYTTLLYTDNGVPYPYILTGVLTNYSQINIALDSISGYENIDLSVALSHDFTNNKDAIGYDWKYLEGDPTTGGSFYYAVHDDWTYIIQNRNGVYFKLKFIRFYNDEGDKGYPTFSFQVL
jgi:hypothetical protein